MSSKEVLSELNEVETEIKVANRKRIEIVKYIQTLNEKYDNLKSKYLALKRQEVANVDYGNDKFNWNEKINKILNETFKLKCFRQQQLAAINAVLSGKDVFVLMPTGGGKSLCYQLPAVLTKGITLVVSPLISLIDDQIMALKALEVEAVTINSTNNKIVSKQVYEAFKTGNQPIKLVYVTPEWLAKSKMFMTNLQKCYQRRGLDRIAIDEVHCCSQWGHDFRPDYKYLGILKNLFPDIPIMGLTATATENIITESQEMLNIEGCLVLKASYNRPNLYYEVKCKPAENEKCVELLADLITRKYKNQSGIIYTFSVSDCVDLANNLKAKRISVACYHANMEANLRQKVHLKWLEDKFQVIVATIAFGMGIDKANVRFVIHHSLPKSMENLYQESGRAGRDDQKADCILLFSLKDVFRVSCMLASTPKGSAHLYKLIDYCIEPINCRRSIIASHFDEVWDESQCNKMCDHCQNPCFCENIDVTTHYKNICKIIEFAKLSETRLTVLKLLDNWLKPIGKNICRPSDIKPPSISRTMAEKIIAFLLINKYLKEDIHFTPYNTISYLTIGSYAVDNIMMKCARNISVNIKKPENISVRNNKRRCEYEDDKHGKKKL